MSVASALTALQADITAARAAVTTKGGTVTPDGGTSQLATDIATIPSGGGEVERKEVNFVDYDGKVLAAYTLAEAQVLDEYPSHPSHEGLTNDGWSRPLSFINALDYPLDIIARYKVADDKLHIFYDATYRKICEFKNLVADKATTFTIDWGDESTPDTVNVANNGKLVASHTYTSDGVKEIKVSTSDTTIQAMPSVDGSYNGVLSRKCEDCIVEIRLPQWIVLSQNGRSYAVSPFGNVLNLLIDSRCVFGLYPNGIFSSLRLTVADCGNRSVVELDSTNGMFPTLDQMNILSIDHPPFVFSSGYKLVRGGARTNVKYLKFPDSITEFDGPALFGNGHMSVVDLPASTTAIGLFTNCFSLMTVICRATVPPSLVANAFPVLDNTLAGANDFRIKVPSGSVEAYKVADNWSVYADYIEAI